MIAGPTAQLPSSLGCLPRRFQNLSSVSQKTLIFCHLKSLVLISWSRIRQLDGVNQRFSSRKCHSDQQKSATFWDLELTLGQTCRAPQRHPASHDGVSEENRVLLRKRQCPAKCRRLGVPGRKGHSASSWDNQVLAHVSQLLNERTPWSQHLVLLRAMTKRLTQYRPQIKDSSTAAPGATRGAPSARPSRPSTPC